MKLLIIEDEIKTANALKRGLEEKGYQVNTANDGETALQLAGKNRYDLIITDIIMPKLNGLDFCGRLRLFDSDTPIIVLTALGMTSDKIKGFELGCDDYMVKPFDFEELLARIKVLINRRKGRGASNLLSFCDLQLNLETREVHRGGKLIDLTAKEYALLMLFLRNPNRIIPKEEIAEVVWGIDFDTGTNVIEVYVSYLRNKIDKDFAPKLIHTKKGMGYVIREEK